MIKGLLDYLTGRAPLKRTLLDKEKEIETYLDIRNCLKTENDCLRVENKFLKEEKGVLAGEKNKQYQTIQELLGNENLLKEQILHLVEKVNRLEIRLDAEKQRADGLLKEVESWKDAALKADKDMKDATQKQKKTPPCRVTGKGKQIRSTGATGKGVKLNKQ